MVMDDVVTYNRELTALVHLDRHAGGFDIQAGDAPPERASRQSTGTLVIE